MKQNLLGQSPYSFKRALDRRIGICIGVCALTIGLNFLFTAARTEQNHALMLVLNIAADILSGCFLVYYADLHIIPPYVLYRLICRDKELLTGSVDRISDETTRYMDMDCRQVTVDGRRLFLPTSALRLEENETYTLSIVSNTIVEAEQ